MTYDSWETFNNNYTTYNWGLIRRRLFWWRAWFIWLWRFTTIKTLHWHCIIVHWILGVFVSIALFFLDNEKKICNQMYWETLGQFLRKISTNMAWQKKSIYYRGPKFLDEHLLGERGYSRIKKQNFFWVILPKSDVIIYVNHLIYSLKLYSRNR